MENSEFNLFQIEKTVKGSASELHTSTQVLPKLGSSQDISFIRKTFESEKSRIFDQAENRLHAQQALLSCILQ